MADGRFDGFLWDGHGSFLESAIRCEAFVRHCDRMGLEAMLVDAHQAPGGERLRQSGLKAYFSQRPKETALIAHNDDYGALAMQLAKSIGLRVLEDFSVVGFDSTTCCDDQKPRLTAVSQPQKQIGELAADLLVDLIAGPRPNPLERILPCGFDIRASTARVPAL